MLLHGVVGWLKTGASGQEKDSRSKTRQSWIKRDDGFPRVKDGGILRSYLPLTQTHQFSTTYKLRWILHVIWIQSSYWSPKLPNIVTVGKPLTVGRFRDHMRRAQRHAETNATRGSYIAVLTSVNESEVGTVSSTRRNCPNFPGNCPEYLVWGMVCGRVFQPLGKCNGE
jgi:hypothetical protein